MLYTVCIREFILSIVISVRVPKWVKKKLEEYGINIADLVRKKLIEEINKIEEERLAIELEELKEKLENKIDPYELSKIIDEERKER